MFVGFQSIDKRVGRVRRVSGGFVLVTGGQGKTGIDYRAIPQTSVNPVARLKKQSCDYFTRKNVERTFLTYFENELSFEPKTFRRRKLWTTLKDQTPLKLV